MNDASPLTKPSLSPPDLRPPMAFTVGVVGHRALADATLPAAAATTKRILAEIAAAVQAFQASDRASPAPAYLAAAPRLRCLSGLAEGADSLMAEAALASGWSLTAVLPFAADEFEKDFSADSVKTLRALLPRATEVFEFDGDRARAPECYVEVGEFLIEHADILLALWDGAPARGAGGTADVIASALRAGKPVLAMAAADPSSWRWLGAAPASLDALVRETLAPATDGEFPQAFFADRHGPALWAVRIVRATDRLLASGAPASPATGETPPTTSRLAPYFDRADRLALAYGASYRAAGLFRYGLIIPATLAALIGAGGGQLQQVAGNLAEFLILVFLVAFSSARWQEATHARFVDYRLLSEQLRGAMLLEPFAALPPWKATEWTAWLTQAYARAFLPASSRQDPSELDAARSRLRAGAAEQISYLLTRATRYELAARRLSRIGVSLSGLGILFAGLRAVLLFAQASQSALLWVNVAALVLPSFGPVFLGLLSFNEYRRNAARYRAIAAQLQTELARLDQAPLQRAPLVQATRRIAVILRNESADWRTLTRIRSVSAF